MLAGGEQDVQLARIGLVGDGGGEPEQLVGGVTHGRDDHDQVVAGRALAGDPARDPLDAIGIRERRAAELLDHEGEGHRPAFYRAGRDAPGRRRVAVPDGLPFARRTVVRCAAETSHVFRSR